jgi:hypothetical protein
VACFNFPCGLFEPDFRFLPQDFLLALGRKNVTGFIDLLSILDRSPFAQASALLMRSPEGLKEADCVSPILPLLQHLPHRPFALTFVEAWFCFRFMNL